MSKTIISSNLLINSGLNNFLNSSIMFFFIVVESFCNELSENNSEPTFEVRIIIVLEKFTVLPWLDMEGRRLRLQKK